MARIYTRTGDDGTTGLIGGKRVSKDSPRIQACGSVDELNAILGVVRSRSVPDDVDKVLRAIQEELFTIGSELAAPQKAGQSSKEIRDEEILRLEKEIDGFEAGLQPLKHFILPGGRPASAELHLARAVARRAERDCVFLSTLENVNPPILRYLNRLSDLLFVLARCINEEQRPTDPRAATEKPPAAN